MTPLGRSTEAAREEAAGVRRFSFPLGLLLTVLALAIGISGATSATLLWPPELSGTASSSDVALTWTDAGAERSYSVMRLDGRRWKSVATVGADTLGFTDESVVAAKTYRYQVVAKLGKTKVASSELAITTADPPAPSPTPAPTPQPSPEPAPSPAPSPSPEPSPESPTPQPSPSPDPSPSSEPSPSPDPSCSGVAVDPSKDIQALFDRYGQGTTFCFAAGTYVLPTFVFPKSYDRLIGAAGAVFTGLDRYAGGVKGYSGPLGQHDVTVRGLVFEHFVHDWNDAGRRAAVMAGWNWLIEDNVIRSNSEAGINITNGAVVRGNHIHHNGRIGISGGPLSDVLVENNAIGYNNTNRNDVTIHAGGLKVIGGSTGSLTLVVRNNWVHDNVGRGLWVDTNVSNVTFASNTIESNSSHGIFVETSWSTVVRNNLVRNNASEYVGKSCFWGSQIHVNDSQGVEIDGNDVRSMNGANGICAVDIDRTSISSDRVRDLYVHDNVLHVDGSAMSGMVGREGSYSDIANNRFVRNTYYVPTTSGKHWAWSTYPIAWNTWRGYGNDTTGGVLTV